MPKQHKASGEPEEAAAPAVHKSDSDAKQKAETKSAAEHKDEAAKPAANDPLNEGASRVSRGGKAEAMRDFLKAQPKVRVFVPLASGEKAGVTQSVILNGYSFYIRKGEYVEVPEAVAEVLDVKMKNKAKLDNHPLRVGRKGEVPMDEFGGAA